MDWEISGWEAQCDAGGLGKGPQWVEARVQAGKLAPQCGGGGGGEGGGGGGQGQASSTMGRSVEETTTDHLLCIAT